MSTPDQPPTPPLTRRQLREIRNTGATPVIFSNGQEPPSPAEAEPAQPVSESNAEDAQATDVRESSVETGVEHSVHEPAEPAPPAAPVASVAPPHHDLGVAPLTRRQAREQERIRTASVPIIAPDAVHEPVAARAPEEPEAPEQEESEASASESADESSPLSESTPSDAGVISEVPGAPEAAPEAPAEPIVRVNPHLGSGLLAGDAPEVELPPSFDQLIARGGGAKSGAISTPNALILSQTPSAAPLVAPVTATGEVIITGTFDLPDGLGSVGHAPGVHDGKEADAVLVDGELPAASSPTPIAASAAISTVRRDDEIIRPPVPEKGSRLVIALAITAGALLLTVAGILVYAFATGIL